MPDRKGFGIPIKFSPEEQELRDRLSLPGNLPSDVETINGPVSHPPLFRTPTRVIGNTLAKNYEELRRIAPEIEGRAKEISPGYNSNIIRDLLEQSNSSNVPYASLAKKLLGGIFPLSLMGTTSYDEDLSDRRPKIFSEYTKDPQEDFNTLAHELQHAVGFGNIERTGEYKTGTRREVESGITGDLAGKVFKLRRGK